MKRKSFRRILSAALTLCMVMALLPTSAFASTTVTPSPNTGNSSVDSLEVEYFSSTLYNWDESAANAATATADTATVYSICGVDTMTSGTLFTITAVDDGYIVSTTIDGVTKYLTYSGANSADAKLVDTATTLLITDNSSYTNTVTFSLVGGTSSYTYPYLNYYNASGCGGWSADGNSDEGSRFYIMDTDGNYVTVSNISSDSQYYIASVRGLTNSYSGKGYLAYTVDEDGYEGKGFYFTSSGNKASSVPAFSSWSGTSQNYTVYTGLAASILSESNNAPFDNDTVNAAELFSTSGNSYTSVYTDVQVPFYIDEDGYYVLDSDTYGVYFANGTAESGATMSIADLPSQYAANSSSALGNIVGFAPFNYLTSTTATGNNSSNVSTTGYAISGSMTYGFGMVTSVDFQMTDDGQLDGEDIIFEFSGDDDVWVYIDGVLALDIGGTHDAITGTINFRTGDVTLTSNYGNTSRTVLDAGGNYTANSDGSLSETNLYTALGTTLTGFASEGTHTMTIYYMDRGQGKTNCLIKFNLPQEDSLSVTKDIASTYTDGDEIDSDILTNLGNIDFSFTLYNGNDTVKSANYSLYDADGNFVQTGSTDSDGQFTLKNGYTAVFNDIDLNTEGTSYKDLSSTRWKTSYSYTAYINSVTTTVEDKEGAEAEVTVSSTTGVGTDTSADYIHYTFTNQYVKGADPDVDVYDETIVLDYGLPVQVDVVSNDTLTLYGKSIGSEYSPVVTYTLVDDGNEVDSYDGTYGTATIDENGKVTYTLTEDFCGIETVKYKISVTVTLETATGNEETKSNSATGTLTIIPATSVYYEEDFSYTGDGSTFTSSDVSSWNNNSNFITISTGYNNTTAAFSVVDDSTKYGTYQETGLVGTTTDSTYGTDEVYLNNLGDSYGTSLKVDTSECSAQYKYTFTGTGTTIYGRVSSNTGYIRVTVTNSKGDAVDIQYIDTVDLVTPSDSSDTNAESILDATLYNIPIYQNTGLESGYDTYTVRIYVYSEGTPTGNTDGSGGEFYLDGIRVFQPMGTSTEDNEDYETAASAYATDGEANVAVLNIHQKIVSDYGEYVDKIFTLTDVNGEIEDIDDYSNIGPNEEFYLNGNGTYTLSFALVNWSSSSYKIYLGLKAPAGESTSVTFSTFVLDEDTDSESTMGTIDVNNSADCYYDISSYVDVHSMTIENDEGEEETVNVGFVTITSSSENLVALTNIKVTGTSKFDLGYSEDYEYDDEGSGDDTSTTSEIIYMTSTSYAASLLTEKEEEVAFEPDSISVSASYASKTKKSTVTVVTSKDVAYVTINGTKVTGTSTAGGKLKFSKSFTKVTKGTTYEVIAYNAEGVASQVYTVTAE
ncbi:MAG: hypothetical protein LUC30_02420 [Clostridiales bacterium]|nr:hypothetical protein [Clostridiales bacterium]